MLGHELKSTLQKEVENDKNIPELPLRGQNTYSVEIKKQLQKDAADCLPYYVAITSYLNMSNDREMAGTITELDDHLYIGSIEDANNLNLLKRHNVTHIIDTVENEKDKIIHLRDSHCDDSHFEYMRFSSDDNDSYPIMNHFDDVFNFIENARKVGGKCLIHCVVGVNRSGVLATAYVMVKYNLGPFAAVKMVQKKRGVLLTNCSFVSKLLIYAKDHGYLEKDALFTINRRVDFKMFPQGMKVLESNAPECIPYYNIIREIISNMRVKWAAKPRAEKERSIPSLITEYLYLGDLYDSQNIETLKSIGISHVINTIENEDPVEEFQFIHSENVKPVYERENIVYMGFSSDDDDGYPIMTHFENVFGFIENVRNNHGKCLIHCAGGRNRSAVLAAGYIMVKHGIDPISAVQHVVRKRPNILSNGSFIVQLLLLAREKQLLNM